MRRYNKEQTEELLMIQPEGSNTKFLKSAHNLWFRFKNYDKHPPFVLEDGGPVALVFITFSDHSRYANLYEIVTLEGKEGNGYASKIYWQVMKEAHSQGMQRLKMSCTPSSVTWHVRNGTIFWAVDPSGSLRCDVPIFPTKKEQLSFRQLAVSDQNIALPSTKVVERLKQEGIEAHKFGKKKRQKVQDSIESVGDYWFRPTLFEQTHQSLEGFF